MNAIPAALGIYSVADAVQLTGAHPRQVRGWLQGYAQWKGFVLPPTPRGAS
jgi:hypothetical protein